MNFLFDAISNMISSVSQGASTFCVYGIFRARGTKIIKRRIINN